MIVDAYYLMLEEDFYREVAKKWDDYLRNLKKQGVDIKEVENIIKNENIKRYMKVFVDR